MFKKTATALLASVAAFFPNMTPASADTFTDYITLTPSICDIKVNRDVYQCDDIIMGALDDGTGNIKLCDYRHCVILIIHYSQWNKIANGRDFMVEEMAFQEGSSITDSVYIDMLCGFSRSDGLGCLGKLRNGLPITIYAE